MLTVEVVKASASVLVTYGFWPECAAAADDAGTDVDPAEKEASPQAMAVSNRAGSSLCRKGDGLERKSRHRTPADRLSRVSHLQWQC